MFYIIGYKEIGKAYFHIALTQDVEEKFKKDFYEDNKFKDRDLKNVKMEILFETEYRDAAQVCKNISLFTYKDHVDFKGNVITKRNAAIQYQQVEHWVKKGLVKKFESNEVKIEDWMTNNIEDIDFFNLLDDKQKSLAQYKASEHQVQVDRFEKVLALLDIAMQEGIKADAVGAVAELKSIKEPYEKEVTLHKSRVWFWTNGKKLAAYFKKI